MPFNLITTKNEDIKALEKEHNEITGQIILKEKALENTFSMLEKTSESAQKYLSIKIDELSNELDKLKSDEHKINLKISSIHLSSKSEINTIEIFRLLISEKGRMKINNFLHSQSVKLIITPVRKKYYSVDIYHADKHIDTIDVSPDGYTARKGTHT